MSKKMRELQAQILELTTEAKGYMVDGEGRDLDKAEETMNKIDQLQKELELEARAEGLEKKGVPADEINKQSDEKVNGFKMFAKMLQRTRLSEAESKALVTGTSDESGASYLVPDDVKAEINELRKTYISAKSLVTVETTDALAGSVNYEDGAAVGLIDFEDGEEIGEETNIKFVRKPFTIKWRGKLIPISRILQGAEKAGLLGYLNRWFVKNAVISENAAIFGALKSGYNNGTPKAVAGWKALKKSITKDLDPSCLIDGVIVTNQSGFACLDEEVDGDGRPILQENPANRTEKMFQGLPIHVFPDAQLENIDATHFPIFYGSTKAGALFVEHQGLEFATSEHYLFNKRQNCLRVVEGFDVMSADTSAYIYGSFSATV